MGDRIVANQIKLIYGHLYQIDLYNETQDQYYRVFIEKEMIDNAEIELED